MKLAPFILTREKIQFVRHWLS